MHIDVPERSSAKLFEPLCLKIDMTRSGVLLNRLHGTLTDWQKFKLPWTGVES